MADLEESASLKFEEAMKTGLLTHAALVGSRKQSTKDVEQLLFHHMAAFLKELKGYNAESETVAACGKSKSCCKCKDVRLLNKFIRFVDKMLKVDFFQVEPKLI